MPTEIFALPGFLGLPTDWDFLKWPHLRGVCLQNYSWSSLHAWADEFNAWAFAQNPSAVLMGYSLGGRLALHALLANPSQWQAAVIVSAHPGLCTLEEKIERQEADVKWARRFANEEWSALMTSWKGQVVFAQDTFQFVRKEEDFHRPQLIANLIQGSLSKQEDLRPQIAELTLPMLWITGSEDARYCEIAKTIEFAHPKSSWITLPNAGHRAPWSQPQHFSEIVSNFLK